jgi:hypothetical protein
VRPIVVTIESLALKGFRYEDRQAIAQALQEQLTHMFSHPRMADRLRGMGDVPRLRIRPINLANLRTPQQVGIAAGREIGRGLGR